MSFKLKKELAETIIQNGAFAYFMEVNQKIPAIIHKHVNIAIKDIKEETLDICSLDGKKIISGIKEEILKEFQSIETEID